MILNGVQQLLVYADDVNMLGGSVLYVHTVKENAEALVVTLEEIGLKLSTWSCLEIRMQDEVQYEDL